MSDLIPCLGVVGVLAIIFGFLAFKMCIRDRPGEVEVSEEDILLRIYMKIKLSTILPFIFLLIGITACSPSRTPAPVLADSAFSCQAFLDVNGNEQIDPEDTPVEGASFYVEIKMCIRDRGK